MAVGAYPRGTGRAARQAAQQWPPRLQITPSPFSLPSLCPETVLANYRVSQEGNDGCFTTGVFSSKGGGAHLRIARRHHR